MFLGKEVNIGVEKRIRAIILRFIFEMGECQLFWEMKECSVRAQMVLPVRCMYRYLTTVSMPCQNALLYLLSYTVLMKQLHTGDRPIALLG